MNNPEDLLQEWASLPDDELSKDWQTQLMQRLKVAQQHRAKKRDVRLQFVGLVLIFVVFNGVFIAQIWQKQGHNRATRQEGLVALSRQFFVKP
jgi:type II secretory pathway component PulL